MVQHNIAAIGGEIGTSVRISVSVLAKAMGSWIAPLVLEAALQHSQGPHPQNMINHLHFSFIQLRFGTFNERDETHNSNHNFCTHAMLNIVNKALEQNKFMVSGSVP